MNDTLRYTRNMQVIHNLHIFKKYFANIWELAFESNIRIAEREIEWEKFTIDDEEENDVQNS